MSLHKPLPVHLQDMQQEIEVYAREYELDFFPIVYEVLDYKTMSEVAAYGGFPTRYPHWRFGMEYEQLSKSYEYGMSKIYEMVINTNPSYAYLLEGNSLVDQKLVMAHVTGHVDFFKNNYFFSKTNRKMIDGMANHAATVRKHVARIGQEKVENFIDVCLSLENLIDPMSLFITREAAPKGEELETKEIARIDAKGYMEDYINPPEFMEEQRKKAELEAEQARSFPEEPARDVLLFLLDYAPLEPWQRDCLEVIRDEAYYYAPQGMTKVMNEGWATYWHSKILTSKALRGDEVIDYADACAGVLATSPGRLNPYKLGVELFRHIEMRWDKGQFGKEWNECSSLAEKSSWDRRLGLGREKIFQVRKLYNDITFIDEFFTLEFCIEQKFYSFGYNERASSWEILSRDFEKVKKQLLDSLTNRGQPVIRVVDGNWNNTGELSLNHEHEGVDLDINQARDTLENLYKIWKRPVSIRTFVEEKARLLCFGEKGYNDRAAEEESQ